MRLRLSVWAVLATSLIARPAPADAPSNAAAPAAASPSATAPQRPAAPAMQPPMNSFDFAFYQCESGAFEIDYDSDTPTQATIVTSNHNRKFALTRTASANGVQFAGGGVKFWTDGKRVLLQGTAIPLANCRLKK